MTGVSGSGTILRCKWGEAAAGVIEHTNRSDLKNGLRFMADGGTATIRCDVWTYFSVLGRGVNGHWYEKRRYRVRASNISEEMALFVCCVRDYKRVVSN